MNQLPRAQPPTLQTHRQRGHHADNWPQVPAQPELLHSHSVGNAPMAAMRLRIHSQPKRLPARVAKFSQSIGPVTSTNSMEDTGRFRADSRPAYTASSKTRRWLRRQLRRQPANANTVSTRMIPSSAGPRSESSESGTRRCGSSGSYPRDSCKCAHAVASQRDLQTWQSAQAAAHHAISRPRCPAASAANSSCARQLSTTDASR